MAEINLPTASKQDAILTAVQNFNGGTDWHTTTPIIVALNSGIPDVATKTTLYSISGKGIATGFKIFTADSKLGITLKIDGIERKLFAISGNVAKQMTTGGDVQSSTATLSPRVVDVSGMIIPFETSFEVVGENVATGSVAGSGIGLVGAVLLS